MKMIRKKMWRNLSRLCYCLSAFDPPSGRSIRESYQEEPHWACVARRLGPMHAASLQALKGEGAAQGADWESVERVLSPGPEDTAVDCWAIAEGSSTPTTKLVVEASPAKPRSSGSTGRSSGRRVPRTGFLEESSSPVASRRSSLAPLTPVPPRPRSAPPTPAHTAAAVETPTKAAMVASVDWATVDWERVRRAVRAKTQLEALADAWLANRSEEPEATSKEEEDEEERLGRARAGRVARQGEVVEEAKEEEAANGADAATAAAAAAAKRDRAQRLGTTREEAAAAVALEKAARVEKAGREGGVAAATAVAAAAAAVAAALPAGSAREAAWRQAVQEDSLRAHAAEKKAERDEAWKMAALTLTLAVAVALTLTLTLTLTRHGRWRHSRRRSARRRMCTSTWRRRASGS